MKHMLKIARFPAWILFILALGLAPGTAAAQTQTRKVGLRLTANSVLTTTFSFRDAFTKSVRKHMKSGLPTRLIVQVAMERQKGSKTVAYWAQTIDVVYDLWEENFAVTVQTAGSKRSTRVKTLEEAINLAGVLWRSPLYKTADLKPGIYRLKVIAEINPVSDEMVRNIQRWIAKPSSSHGGAEQRTNFFGSFVGHFVDRDIGKADKTVKFNSQWFQLGGASDEQ